MIIIGIIGNDDVTAGAVGVGSGVRVAVSLIFAPLQVELLDQSLSVSVAPLLLE